MKGKKVFAVVACIVAAITIAYAVVTLANRQAPNVLTAAPVEAPIEVPVVKPVIRKTYIETRPAVIASLRRREIREKGLGPRIWVFDDSINTVYLRLGMSDVRVRELMGGSPQDINRTVGSYGVHAQWVYEHTYLYFEDGILTAIQDS